MGLSKLYKKFFGIRMLALMCFPFIVYLPCTRADVMDEYPPEVGKFNTEDCTQIATNGSCSCKHQSSNNATLIECASGKVHITLNNENGVEITCKDHLEPHVLATLPQLGALRETNYIATFKCKSITEIFAQMALTPRHTLQIHGLEALDGITPQTFGHDLERLKKVIVLELRAKHKTTAENYTQHKTQQLCSDILQSMPSLFRLTVDLKFTELPADLFKPVVDVNDVSLIGDLVAFPRSTFRVLRRLRELSMRQHRFFNNLRNDDFQVLTTIRGLYLANCSITELPPHIFAPLKMLQRLNLMDNNLRLLPVTLLAKQQRLQILNLSGNLLESLPIGLFAVTTKLLKLILSRNRLRHLDSKILPPLTAMIELSAYSNELRTIALGTFAQANRLQGLDLRNNKLDWASADDCDIFEGLKRLERLLLSNNSLHYLCDKLGSGNHSTSALSYIDVRQNKLKLVSTQLIKTLNTSATMAIAYLSENPWACNCSAQPLLNFVKNNRKRLKDERDMRCANTRLPRLRELSFRDFCLPEIGVQTVVVVILVCASVLGLLLTTTALCYYKYNIELKIWLYAHQLGLCCVSERDVDRDRKWDAFISYSHHDEKFVEKELVPGLEQGSPSFKVCIHVRDWLAGAYIPEQIIDSVEQSRRTIIVLSQHFIVSDWAQMEFRTAHQCAVNEGRSRIIIVVYGEIKDTELLDQELTAYLKTNTYLKWDDPWFWRKLRYAMPHEQRDMWARKRNTSDIENNV
ncbi:toll-like receptor Tollo [Eurosta solidaginis]|uniref:toll-like receptor Tollo n=1 Tax=Eurosta solidaginis TaxID=178769 RepID=UPI003531035B